MARTFNGSSQYLSAGSTLLADEPISMACLGNSDSVAVTQTPMSLGNNGASGFYETQFAGAAASDPIRAAKVNDGGGSVGIAASSAGYGAGAWHHAIGVFINDTSRAAYKDGGSKGTNATSVANPTPDYVTVGVRRLSGNAQYFDGSIAEAFIMDYQLNDAQAALMAGGIHPIDACIPIANIRAWYPLMGDDNNRMGGGYPNLSPTDSPTFGTHPVTPIYPRIGALICL